MTRAASPRPHMTEAWVRIQNSLCEIYGAKSGTGTDFFFFFFFRALRFYPVSITLLVLHIHISFVNHTRCTALAVDSVVDKKDECVQNFSRKTFCKERLLGI